MQKVIVILPVFGIILMNTLCFGVSADGYCYLEDEDNHWGTKVLFIADSPGAVTDSTYTAASGYYQMELESGIYDIRYVHFLFYDHEVTDQPIFSSITLPEVTLTGMIGYPISGPLSGTAPGINYLVVGDIEVVEGESLFIQPGATFYFDGDFHFDVNGYLSAVGSETDSITFMLNNGITQWQGIDFNATVDDSSVMEYCSVSGSVSGGITIDSVDLTIGHCSIFANQNVWGGGIYGYNSSALISHCELYENTATEHGGGVGFDASASPVIEYCDVHDNSCGIVGGGINFATTDGAVRYCIIRDNVGNAGGGLGFYLSNATVESCVIESNEAAYGYADGGGVHLQAYGSSAVVEFLDCLIADNTATEGGGLFVLDNVAVHLERCVVSGNYASVHSGGLYIKYDDTGSLIENCTFSGNQTPGNGGGISCTTGTTPTIINTIVEGNTGIGAVYFDSSSDPTVTYCDFSGNDGGNFSGNPPEWLGFIVTVNANGDSCDLFYNIFEDPMFVDKEEGDYHLLEESPCIDAGDPDSPPDPDESIADIGALYYHKTGVDVTPESFRVRLIQGETRADEILIGNTASVPYFYWLNSGSDWISFPEDSGTVESNSIDSLTVMFDTETLSPGIYHSDIVITTDDPYHPEFLIPVIMIVYPSVTIELFPEDVSLGRGDTLSFDIVITNNSDAMFQFTFETEVIFPNQTVYGPLVGPVTALLLPHGSINGEIEHVIPGIAPLWEYTYVVKAVMPLKMVIAEAEFMFEVTNGGKNPVIPREFTTTRFMLGDEDYLNW